jgi:hypothetical protein
VFPLFRPTGESYPHTVVPLEVDTLVCKMLAATHWGSDVDATSVERGRLDKEKEKAKKIVLSLFESVGVILGFAIRNSCPVGFGTTFKLVNIKSNLLSV